MQHDDVGRATPLVSCIMPTRNRRAFVPRAIRCFLRQSQPHAELVILDDGDDAVADLVPADPRIRYERLPQRVPLGTKRNLACEAARGDVIVHWDDDDWMADHRLSSQLPHILDGSADMTGLDGLYFLEATGRRAWLYEYRGNRRPWLAGGTLAYTRDCWRQRPFPPLDVGEDTRFVWRRAGGRLLALPDRSIYVATVHAGNTSPKRTAGAAWQPVTPARIRALMGQDWPAQDAPTAAAAAPQQRPAPARPDASPARALPSRAAPSHPAPSRLGPSRAMPRLAVVLPVHTAAAPLLERTLLSLEAQDCDAGSFEVIVAADGGDGDGAIRRTASGVTGYACRVVDAPRPRGDLPHRNHARNAGCGAARAPLLWVLDADFILPPHAIAHALSLAGLAARAGGPVQVLSPCLASIPMAPDRWLRETAAAVSARDAAALLRTAHAAAPRDDQYSGFASSHRPGRPRADPWPRMLEGFPLVPAALWRAIGGFDEDYVGWGGNKEEFVRRLVALGHQGIAQVRLLRSVLALHQPHAPDPGRARHERTHNQRRFRRTMAGIEGNAPWWQGQVQRARHAVSGASRPVRVGLLTVADPRKGLRRDAEALLWALDGPPVRPAATATFEVSVFATDRLREDVDREPSRAVARSIPRADADPAFLRAAVPPGTRFVQWVSSLDVMIAGEVWLGRAFDVARQAGVRVVYVPNLEWAGIGDDCDAWVRAVQGSGVEVWGKTEQAVRVLQDCGITAVPVPWSVPDPVRAHRAVASPSPLRLLMVAGMGGWRGRRGVDIALAAFALARSREPRVHLTVQCIRPVAEVAAGAPLDTPGLHLLEGYRSRAEIAALHDDADVVLYPSRFEGFGLSLLEALHAGLPVIATDGEPMRELVEHGHNGLLARADAAGRVRLATAWECSPAALADCMVRIAGDPHLRRRLTCPEPGALAARQHRFRLTVRRHVASETPPRVVILHDRSPAGARRSELFWADALRDHGYHVACIGIDQDEERVAALAHPHDLVLVSKPPPALLRVLRRESAAPLVMWHHDLSAASPARLRWFREAAPLCDVVAVPHPVAAADAGNAHVLHLFPGPKTHGVRGPGRRPPHPDPGTVPPPAGNDVVFLGAPTPDRVAALAGLLRAGIPVRVFGEHDPWRAAGIPCAGPRFGAAADAVIAAAGVVLATSASNDVHYTSNRLFHSAGAGGCLLVRRFPGLDTLYPPSAIATWDDDADLTQLVSRLLANPDRRRAMAAAAEEVTFQRHSWHHRVSYLLEAVRHHCPGSVDRPAGSTAASPASAAAPPAPRPAAPRVTTRAPVTRAPVTMAPISKPPVAPVPYVPPVFWRERALRLGERSVGHHAWSDAEFARETERCWVIMRRLLLAHRRPGDCRVLDFGCGTGRFSRRLAQEGLDVVGVDVTMAMLSMARAALGHGVALACIPGHGPLPFADHSFHVVWVSCTLQHVTDDALPGTIAELRRVLRPGGLIIAMENTLRHPGRTSPSGHIVFRRPAEYLAAFPGVIHARNLRLAGEPHAVFAGRLRS